MTDRLSEQDNDPKPSSKSNRMTKRKESTCFNDLVKVVELTTILWWDLQKAVHKHMPANFNEQKCKAGWAEIPQKRCDGRTKSNRKPLLKVSAAQDGSTSY